MWQDEPDPAERTAASAVEIGDTVLRLRPVDSRDLAAAALDNRGSYTAAQAAYATATQAQVPEDYQKAQLDVAQAKANLDLNQSIVSARKQLFAEGAIPAAAMHSSR